jgi:hypothetical protein
VSGVWCLVSGVWRLVSGVWRLASGLWTLEISSFPIRAIRLIRGSKSSHFLKFAFPEKGTIHESKPYSMDLPEGWGELGTTKPVKTEPSDRHGRQRGRIRDRSRPVCCSSCLLLVLFAAASCLLQRPVCCSVLFAAASCLLRVLFAAGPVCCGSCLLQRQGFVPHARGWWWNRIPRTSGKSSIYLEIFSKKILLLFF